MEKGYAQCRACQNRRTRESYARHRKKRLAKAARWGAAHKERRAEQNRRSKLKLYGLTPEKAEEQLKVQSGKCANPGCGSTTPGNRRKNWRIGMITLREDSVVYCATDATWGWLCSKKTKLAYSA
jgi:hypothetical protein